MALSTTPSGKAGADLQHGRVPMQGRSRASFERMMLAARTLLAERGSDDFSLAEVSKRGRVSIGSIYCRFDSKDDLLRAVQAAFSADLDAEQQTLIDRAARKATDLPTLVDLLVNSLGEMLKRHAPIMRPLMLRANTDAVIARIGKIGHQKLFDRFTGELLVYRSDIRHPDPERAIASTFRIQYAAVARFLGFGSSSIAAGEGSWEQLKQDLSDMSTSFLMTPPAQTKAHTKAPAKTPAKAPAKALPKPPPKKPKQRR